MILVCVLSRDGVVRNYKKMQSRLLGLFYTERIFELRLQRQHLHKAIVELVNKYGPIAFEDFKPIKRNSAFFIDQFGQQQDASELALMSEKHIQVESGKTNYQNILAFNKIFESIEPY
jgi:hypothetical protein